MKGPLTRELYDAILVDDDFLVRLVWTRAAALKGKKFKAFSTPQELKESLSLLDLETPIYLDSNLGGGIRGEEIAKDLRQQGFSKIYLETGYDASEFSSLKEFNGITGKDPPWL